MGIHKYKIGETLVNLYDVVGFQADDDTLIVFTRGETLYFNSPNDIEDVAAELTALEAQYDTLQVTWEGYQAEAPETPEVPEEPETP